MRWGGCPSVMGHRLSSVFKQDKIGAICIAPRGTRSWMSQGHRRKISRVRPNLWIRCAELISIAGISLPSVVSAEAATPCLVQIGSRVPISPACSSAGSALGGNRHHRARVPVRDLYRPTLQLGQTSFSFRGLYASARFSPGGDQIVAGVTTSRVKRNSVSSRHIRWSTIPMRRARATVARFLPRRCATLSAQLVNQLFFPR